MPSDRASSGHCGRCIRLNVLYFPFSEATPVSSLVRHLPEKETSTLTIKCEADGARFFASGTTRFHVKEVTVDGKPSEPFNVYPGVPILVKGAKIKVPQQAEC